MARPLYRGWTPTNTGNPNAGMGYALQGARMQSSAIDPLVKVLDSYKTIQDANNIALTKANTGKALESIYSGKGIPKDIKGPIDTIATAGAMRQYQQDALNKRFREAAEKRAQAAERRAQQKFNDERTANNFDLTSIFSDANTGTNSSQSTSSSEQKNIQQKPVTRDTSLDIGTVGGAALSNYLGMDNNQLANVNYDNNVRNEIVDLAAKNAVAGSPIQIEEQTTPGYTSLIDNAIANRANQITHDAATAVGSGMTGYSVPEEYRNIVDNADVPTLPTDNQISTTSQNQSGQPAATGYAGLVGSLVQETSKAQQIFNNRLADANAKRDKAYSAIDSSGMTTKQKKIKKKEADALYDSLVKAAEERKNSVIKIPEAKKLALELVKSREDLVREQQAELREAERKQANEKEIEKLKQKHRIELDKVKTENDIKKDKAKGFKGDGKSGGYIPDWEKMNISVGGGEYRTADLDRSDKELVNKLGMINKKAGVNKNTWQHFVKEQLIDPDVFTDDELRTSIQNNWGAWRTSGSKQGVYDLWKKYLKKTDPDSYAKLAKYELANGI